jgi:hypothetical protein
MSIKCIEPFNWWKEKVGEQVHSEEKMQKKKKEMGKTCQ